MKPLTEFTFYCEHELPLNEKAQDDEWAVMKTGGIFSVAVLVVFHIYQEIGDNNSGL